MYNGMDITFFETSKTIKTFTRIIASEEAFPRQRLAAKPRPYLIDVTMSSYLKGQYGDNRIKNALNYTSNS
jgi:hypothetical protein